MSAPRREKSLYVTHHVAAVSRPCCERVVSMSRHVATCRERVPGMSRRVASVSRRVASVSRACRGVSRGVVRRHTTSQGLTPQAHSAPRRLATQPLAARASCPAAARVSGCSRRGRSSGALSGRSASRCTKTSCKLCWRKWAVASLVALASSRRAKLVGADLMSRRSKCLAIIDKMVVVLSWVRSHNLRLVSEGLWGESTGL